MNVACLEEEDLKGVWVGQSRSLVLLSTVSTSDLVFFQNAKEDKPMYCEVSFDKAIICSN